MLKKELKLLKYIDKKGRISRNKLLEKFPELENLQHYIGRYIIIEDELEIPRREQEEKLIIESHEMGMNIAETSQYIENNIQDIPSDNDKIYYSINHDGLEFLQYKKQNLLSFVLPYTITTLIAIASIIVQLVDLIMR